MSTRLLAGLVFFLSILSVVACGGGSNTGTKPFPAPTPLPADFQLFVESPTVTAQQGGAPQFQNVQAQSSNGFNGTINLSFSGLPAGVALSPSGPSAISAGFTANIFQLFVSPAAPVGTTTVTVTGTSGTITHTVTFSLIVKQAAPFAIHVSPLSISLTPASRATVQISVTSDPATSPSLIVNVSSPPNSFQVDVGSPGALLTPTNPVSFSILASVLAQPLQNFPVAVVASDNANNTSAAILSLSVTIPFVSNSTPTRSTFSRTDKSPTGMVYDPFRKLLFVSVEIMNEVAVLSSVDGHRVASIPVEFPAGIDEAADGSAVYVGSPFIDGVTTIDPDLLQVVGHSSVPQSVSGTVTPVTFFQVAALANGKVLLFPSLGALDLTKPPFFLWDPKTDTFTRFGPPSLTSFAGLISRTSDHSKVLGFEGAITSNGGYIYDVATDSFQGPNAAITGFPAIRLDGSQLASLSLDGLNFYDGNFNLLASFPGNALRGGGSAPRLFYSRDGKRLYVVPDQSIGVGILGTNPVVTVIDTTTFALIGLVPAFSFGATLPFSGQSIATFDLDETGMLFGAASGGVGFLDMSSPTFLQEPLPLPFLVNPSLASLSSPSQAQLSGVGFIPGLGHDVFIGAAPASPQTLKATNISVPSTNFVNLTVPPGIQRGPANVTLMRADGFFEVVPDVITFGPAILRVDADAGSPSGGATINITGHGLSQPNTQVSIAGTPAVITSQRPAILGNLPFPTETLTLKTPPGVSGLADVTVSTLSGSTTVPGGFQYLKSVQIHPIVGALDALVYDQPRQRLYVSNQDHNRVEVFDLVTNTFLAPVTVGNSPTALALTPDGNLLAVVNRADGTVSTINPATMSVTATFSLLTAADKDRVGCDGEVLNIVAAQPHRAVAGLVCRALLFNGVFHLINLDTGSLDCTGIAGCGPNGTDFVFNSGLAALAATADGGKIFMANTSGGGSGLPVALLDLVANTLTFGTSGDFSDAAVSADGTIFAGNFGISDGLHLLGIMAFEPYADAGSQSFHNVFGEKLNPSGSLLFYPQDSGVTIFDTHTGRLALHVVLPDPIPLDSGGLALDETGTKMFLISNTGITIAELFQAPLSLATVNPSSGPQGTPVVIRGSGYQNGATVTFGAMQVPATFVDSNTLKATVPVLPPGSVRVSIKNPDGHQYSFDAAFTVK